MTLRALTRRAPLYAAFRFFARAGRNIALAIAVVTAVSAPAMALTQPKWSDLSPARQEALKPLAGEWDKLDDTRRKKWMVVADRYASMAPEEKKRLQTRMADWARLTPDQRRLARENYQKSKALPPEQKKAQWDQYQTLPDAQKQQLAASVEQKKPARQKAQRREHEGKVVKPGQTQRPRTVRPVMPGASPVIPTTPVSAPATDN